MQVKKFKAESIGDALHDIKEEFGPEAIILSSSEERGQQGKNKSFIVVAAVSEAALKKKQYTEKKLGQYGPEFSKKPARVQKEIIDDLLSKKMKEKSAKNKAKTITNTRYAEIEDDSIHLKSGANSGREQKAKASKRSSRPRKESQGSRSSGKAVPTSRKKNEVQSDLAQAQKVTSAKKVENAVKDIFNSQLATQFFKPLKSKNQKAQGSTEGKNTEELVLGHPKRDQKQTMSSQDSRTNHRGPQLERHPSKDERRARVDKLTKKLVDKLLTVGVSRPVVKKVVDHGLLSLGSSVSPGRLDARVGSLIMDGIKTVIPNHFSGIEFFVGPQGMGKTTSVIKLASEYRVKTQKNFLIVSTDNRLGGLEALKIYSRILNAHLVHIPSIDDWKNHLSTFEKFDNILVDTPGVSLTSEDEYSFLRQLTNSTGRLNARTHLVLSANCQTNELLQAAQRFAVSSFSDLIFTNIDRSSQHGVLLNYLDKVPKPLHSFGNGVDCLEGFEWATKERILDLIYKLTTKNGEKVDEPQI